MGESAEHRPPPEHEAEPYPLDAGLHAAFQSSAERRDSILDALGIPSERVALPDPPEEHTPVVVPGSAELSPGERHAGRYRLLGELGQGGVGVIVKSRDLDLGRDVAMKLLRKEYASEPAIVARFVEEAQIGAQLQHPGIVPIYEIGLLAGRRPYFTMKIVKGRTLAALLSERASPAEDLRRYLGIFEQVCHTVAYAHSRGVVHRDIKPGNIMVGSCGEVQVMDWGFAKVLSPSGSGQEFPPGRTQSQISIIQTIRSVSHANESLVGSVIGTPAYMSPEQAQGDLENLDAASDVFALGAVLLEILTGAPPYTGENNEVLLFKAARCRLEEAFERLHERKLSPALENLVRECLAPARRARPQNAAVVAITMTNHLAQLEDSAQRETIEAAAALARAEATRRSRRLVVVLAASVIVAALFGTAGYLWVSLSERARQGEAASALESALAVAALERSRAEAAPDDLARWGAALSAARHAVSRSQARGVPPATAARAARLLSEAEQRLSDLQTAAECSARDESLCARLLDLRARPGGRGPDLVPGQALIAALHDHGIDPLRPSEFAAKVGASPRRLELCATVCEWAGILPSCRPDEARKAMEAVSLVDADPLRNQIRNILLRRGENIAEVLRLLARSLGPNPDPVTADLLGHALGSAGALEEAVAVLRAAAASDPADFWVRIHLARWLMALDPPRSDEAVQHFSAAVVMRPASAEAHHGLVHALLSLDRAEEAAEIAVQAVAKAGPAPDTRGHLLAHRADALIARGRTDLVGPVLGEAATLDPGDPLVECVFARDLLARGLPAEAAARFTAALTLDPGLEEAHEGRIRALHAAGQLSALTEAYRAAAAVGSTSPGGPRRFAECLRRAGDPERADAQLRIALERAPGDPDVLHTRGLVLLDLADEAGARDAFAAEAQARPRRPEAHHWLGLTLAAQGDLEQAEKALREAARVGHDPPPLLVDRARVLVRLGRREDAFDLFHRASLATSGDAAPLEGMAEIYTHRGDLARAVECLRKAVAVDPRSLTARRSLLEVLRLTGGLAEEIAKLEADVTSQRTAVRLACLALAREAEGRIPEAEALYQETASREPGWAEALVLLGRMIERTQGADAALEVFRRAAAGAAPNPEALYLAGLLLLDRGAFVEAHRLLRQAHGLAVADSRSELPTRVVLDEAVRMLALAPLLEDYATGKRRPDGAQETVRVARLCDRCGRFEAAAGLFAEAFAADAGLRREPVFDNGYRAARDAVRASRWAEALDHMSDGLALLEWRLARGAVREVHATVDRWLREPAFASLRDGSAIAARPAAEAASWRLLWRRIEAIRTECTSGGRAGK